MNIIASLYQIGDIRNTVCICTAIEKNIALELVCIIGSVNVGEMQLWIVAKGHIAGSTSDSCQIIEVRTTGGKNKMVIGKCLHKPFSLMLDVPRIIGQIID